MSISSTIFLDNRRLKKKTENYPVKLRITCNRLSREYQTIYDLTVPDYNKLKAPNISEALQKVRDGLRTIQSEVDAAAKRIDPFNFTEFKRDFIDTHPLFKQRKDRNKVMLADAPSSFDYSEYYKKFPLLTERYESASIGSVYSSYIKQLLSEKRIGSALKYRDSYSSLKKFGGADRFSDITVSYLRRYETWMLERGCSKTTIGMILRALRAIFNEADHQGIINKSKCYPFGRRKYLIPTSRKVKKALSHENVAKIYYDRATCRNEEFAKALWFFCYFGNGMNPNDLAHLKYKNIHGEYLHFYRAKTELTARNDPKLITVYISEDMRNFIDRWGNKDVAPDNYIFPILQSDLTPLQEYSAVTRLTQFINDWMKKIGQRLNIAIEVTTVVTRHTFATLLKKAGASTEFIQESLGHTIISTTENYLDSFENEVKKEFAGKLTAFKEFFSNSESD
ncbi:site-specific integrase [uncultured Chitinophaga sp.]|jgi:Site-specific recombinase XerD|uniref:tyrosine-type recombinase/integrase n=1 Tax=uncultured Chitinophaga sp. TaxID=339340 RepID=UPI00260973A6|nr:site-specific integrase [uncultured Chitinophaga sp.]